MNYKTLPKIDLHCHLDGSVRPSTIVELAKEANISVPKNIHAELIAPETCQSLDEYLLRFDLPVQLMQSQSNLERIAYELYEDAAKENVKYMEVRFGPLLHLNAGLTIDDVLSSVLEGIQRAETDYGIKGNIIISVLRTMPKDRIIELIDTAENYLFKGIVAIDLAASEIAGFCDEFKSYIDYARKKNFHVTIHAGETGVGKNVSDAIELLHAERIGHGIFIKDDSYAFDLVKTQETILEVCPTSNVQTKAVIDLENHPIKMFLDENLRVTINTDNRTVSNTTMTTEIKRVVEMFDLSEQEYYQIYKNSVMKAFVSPDIKENLLSFCPD